MGGTVLSASTLYLGVAELRARTAHNSAALRDARARLDALRRPAVLAGNPRPYVARPSLAHTLKDRWNAEVEAMYRWAEALDWVRIRERVEDGSQNLVRNLRR